MEEGEGDTGARVKNKVPESRQPTMASRVGTDSTGEESWVRSSKGQKGVSPSLAEPQDTCVLSARSQLCLWYLSGGHSLRP